MFLKHGNDVGNKRGAARRKRNAVNQHQEED